MKKNGLKLSIFIALAFVFCLTGCPMAPNPPPYDPLSSFDFSGLGNIQNYTVNYNINDGTGTIPDSQTVAAGASVTLADGNALQRDGYFFGGWNTSSLGTGTIYAAGSTYKPTKDITLYAMWWSGPRIRTEDTYKEVTSIGKVRISLLTGFSNIDDVTDEYRLYRSETQNGVYSLVATIAPVEQPVLEDNTADWLTLGSYFYKIAAVVDGTELMSMNGVKINRVSPKVYMQYSTISNFYGYCGVRLFINDNEYYEWTGTTSSLSQRFELQMNYSSVSPGNYTLQTKSSSIASWRNNGALAIRASHVYTIITGGLGSVDSSSFDKTRWTFFTP